jgi:hypothetical protein
VLFNYFKKEEENRGPVGFEVLTAVVMKGPIFWDIMLCSLLKVKQISHQNLTPLGMATSHMPLN